MAGHLIYRESCLGKSLKMAVEEMVLVETLPENLVDVVMQLFDAAIREHIKPARIISSTTRPAALEGEIRDGAVESYRFVDNVWTFNLAKAAFKGGVFAVGRNALHVDRVRVICADAKVFELPLGGAGSSAAGGSSDAQLFAQFDGASCELPPGFVAKAKAAFASGRRGARQGVAAAQEPRAGAAAPARRVPQGDGGEDDDDLLEEEDDDEWEEAPAPPAAAPPAGSSRFAAGSGAGAAADDDLIEDEEDDLLEEEEEEADVAAGGKRSAEVAAEEEAARKRAKEAADDEELNSGDDSEGEGADKVYTNVVLAQFDSVKRIRNKWSMKLKAGFATLHGVDYVFTSANAEWEY